MNVEGRDVNEGCIGGDTSQNVSKSGVARFARA